MTSFPVPDSPWMSTVLSVGATCSASLRTSWKARDLPSGLTSPERSRRRISCLSCLFSALRIRCSAALSRLARWSRRPLLPSTGSGARPGSPSRRRRPESMAAGSCRFLFPPGGGEVNRERRSLPRRRVHQHQATVRIHGALHNGEAEAGAADSTRDERLEQAGPQVFRDARAVVAHGQGYGSLDTGASRQLVRGGSSGPYYDAGALPRGLDGVQHQVRHHSV